MIPSLNNGIAIILYYVLYALLLDPGCCLRAHIILIELVEPEEKKINNGIALVDVVLCLTLLLAGGYFAGSCVCWHTPHIFHL